MSARAALGTGWDEAVPEGWDVRKLKYLAHIRNSNVDKRSEEGEQPVRLCNYTDVYYNDRITADLDFMPATASRAEIARFRLRRGDVLITKDSESPDDIAVPAYVEHDLADVLCGYHLALVRPIEARADGRFLAYSFSAQPINLQFRTGASGITRYGLSVDVIASSVHPLPPTEEQREISAFLDDRVAAIDGVIRRKERMLALLEERRQAVIDRAVAGTRGPDDPEVRPIERSSLPGSPRDGQFLPIKYVATLNRAVLPESTDPDTPFTYVDIGSVDRAGRIKSPVALTFGVAPTRARRRVAKGDTLVSTVRTYLKAIAHVEEEVDHLVASTGFAVVSPGAGVHARFLFYWMRSSAVVEEISARSVGVSYPAVNASEIGRLGFPRLPIETQKAAADSLDRQTAAIDLMKREHARGIELLREYRQTLISHAVTGRLPVSEPAGL